MELRDKVCQAYSKAATSPAAKHPFPVGVEFARAVGYPDAVLSRIPSVARESFTGVSNVSVFAQIPSGAQVLDLGCGAGLDTLVAAFRGGPDGRVVSVDFSEAMLARARSAASRAEVFNVHLIRGDAECLPLDGGSVDVVIVNGIFNLNQQRTPIFSELARVTRPGGLLYAAELILREALPDDEARSESNWFA